MKHLEDEALAYALLRLALGINFFGHGLVRLLGGVGKFASGMVAGFEKTILPLELVRLFGTVLPAIELALGILLILGAFSRLALIGGALLMCALTFGTTLQSNWNGAGSQLLYSLVFFVLLFLRRWNTLSIDGWRQRRTASGR